jgi:hypothetical protein
MVLSHMRACLEFLIATQSRKPRGTCFDLGMHTSRHLFGWTWLPLGLLDAAFVLKA